VEGLIQYPETLDSWAFIGHPLYRETLRANPLHDILSGVFYSAPAAVPRRSVGAGGIAISMTFWPRTSTKS